MLHGARAAAAAFLGFLLVLAVLVGLRVRERSRADRLAVIFFDVGQGDSALVAFPGGRTLLVDAGGGFGDRDVGRRELYRELLRMSIRRLDVALLSHPDQDHAYGFVGLLEELPVGELWVNAAEDRWPRKPLYAELRRLAALQQVTVRSWKRESEARWGGATLRLVPLAPSRATNERALVLRLEYAGCTVLFTGDIEREGERQLEAWWRRERAPSVTLLKVAHHGSRTSSAESFVGAVRPRWAVISVGQSNRYGHPRPEVVDRLRGAGAVVFRTDFHGYVKFEIGKQGQVRCETALGECGVGRCGEPSLPAAKSPLPSSSAAPACPGAPPPSRTPGSSPPSSSVSPADPLPSAAARRRPCTPPSGPRP